MNTTIVGHVAAGVPREVAAARRTAVHTVEPESGQGAKLRRLSAGKPVVSHGALVYNNVALPKPGTHAGTHVDTYA